jgi:hypothetical protein
MLELNDWLGVEAIRFGPYDVGAPAAALSG